ncbi:MAG: T9SS type A sorting domain-containing protein, partial [Bacteroidetes bacterium]|nr:T9SS type A sorting domain-containing protein [Bacteroidota bacterium]
NSFDVFGVNTNGWISLGQSTLSPSIDMTSTSDYNVISATSSAPSILQNKIAVLARDMQGQVGSELSYELIGTAPNRVLVVQWENFRRYDIESENYNFQIRLYETTNIVEFVYGSFTVNYTGFTNPQVGLRGETNSDFNNRTTSTDWVASTSGTSNTDLLTLTTTIYPPTGLTFSFTPPVLPQNDASILSINSPNTPVSIGSSPITATIKNFGTSALANATIEYSVNGVTQTPAYSWNGPLATSATDGPVTIGNYNFATAGLYTIKAWSSNPNGITDGKPSNDTATKVVYVQSYTSLPFAENFDGTWVNKIDTNDVPSTYWINTPAFGNQSWRRDDEGVTANWNSLSSYSYTPAGSVSTPHSARFHSGYSQDNTTGIMDVFLDFSSVGNKSLKFWYINTTGTDSLKVLLSTDGGSNFTFLNQYTTASTWQLKQISLGASTSSTVVIRFMAIADYGNTDIGIDGVQVALASAIDLGITSILKPISKPCGLATDSVNVIIKNFGATSQNTIPVVVNITTPSGSDVLNGTLTATLAPNAIDTLFVGYVNTVDGGNYTFKAFTNFTGDTEPINDTILSTITTLVSNVPTYPFTENFEASNSLTNWTTNMSRSNLHGNTSYVMYKNLYNSTTYSLANATYNIKIGTLTSTSVLTFDYRYTNYTGGTSFTLGLDSLKVQVSDDCGATFTTIHVISAANHITSANMKNVLVSLSAYSGEDILIKFIAKRGTYGDYYIDIDNIEVLDAASVGVNEYSNTSELKVYPNPSTGIVNIISNGFTTNANLNVYNLQGQSVYSETISGGSNNQINLSYLPKGVYMIKVSNNETNLISRLVIQ